MRASVAFLLLIAFGSPSVAAHAKDYVNVTGDQFILPNDCNDEIGISQGGVCFSGGHIAPDANGRATVSLWDKKFSPTSGCHQQAGRPCEPFCGSFVLQEGAGWDPAKALDVFVDGPVFGNFLLSPCGFGWWTQGVLGQVTHT
jgi:hypothetical protein